MGGLIETGDLALARAFCGQPLLDFRIVFDSNEIRRHVFLRKNLV
jgi:hypothetical protein